MKQKRKVKSLISPRSGSNVLLTVLLILGGGVLFLGAVALFTSLGGVASAAGESAVLDYDNGIDDQVEVLLNLKFAQSGIVVNTVNEMEFSGNTFYMKGDKGISIETTAASIDSSKNVNYLGGEEDGMNVASNNVTIIGGGKAKIYQGNDNAAILGGISSRVVEGGNKEAPVMVGGNSNEITVNQEGSAIIGGNSNKIVNGGKYDFILGGDNNSVNGDNVIVGGANVNVAGKSHLFAFSDGRNLNPGGGNAFYLYVRNGLGLSKAAVNKGVDSNGAVKIGLVNINTSCTTEDVGVQGIWQVEAGGYGCLVGCTLASKNDHNKWEMMDHSDTCEGYCKNNEGRCMVKPIEPTPLTPYTSKCSVGGVDTSNSTQCAANRLDVYENVIFETYLIDSDDSCPSTDETNNRCVFKCDKDYHLTGNTAGGTSKTKCYADCTLPWNGEKIKHNERVDAYNAKTVACSNTDWVFPAATAIINVPTRGYPNTRTWNGMLKTTEAAGKSFESCTNYDHKKTLICNNGTLYIANGTRATSTKALGSTGAGNWYGYDTCTTRDYTCPTSIYNLKRSDITDRASDNPKPGTEWNNTDRGITQGVRGQYKLCQDWTPSVGNSDCKVGLNGNNGTIDNNYHYQLVRCQQGYSTGTDNNPYECKQSCYLSGTSIEFKHNMGVTGYKHDSRTCTDICDDEWIVCNDGKWRVGTKDGTPTTDYHYYNCVLNDKVCANNFDVKQTEKDEGLRLWGDHSVYATACVPYSGNGKFQCDEKPKLYDLINCNPYPGYHTENNKYCRDDDDEAWCKHQGASVTKNFSYIDKKVPIEWINSTSYNNGKWSTPANCAWKCNSDSHMENGDCEKDAKLVRCDDTWVPSTANATMVRVRVYWQPSAEDYTSADACAYTCKPGYEGSDCETACHDVVCPADEYPFTSATCPEHGICGSSCTPQSADDCSRGSSVVALTDCVGEYHVSDDRLSCEPDDNPGGGDDGDDPDPNPEPEVTTYTTCGGSAGTAGAGCTVEKGVGTYPAQTTQIIWGYTSSSTPGTCRWTCGDGCMRSSNKCVKAYTTCGGDEPMGDGLKVGASTYTAQTTQKQWTKTSNSTLGACQWTCEEGAYEAADWVGCTTDPSKARRIPGVDPEGCDGPCGSVDSGETLTCYEPGVQCTSTSTKAGSQTRTCSNGSWDNDFDSSYTDASPSLSSKTCSSTEYPYEGTCDDSHGQCATCIEYSQNGDNNACKKGTTRYDILCDQEYEPKDGKCELKEVSCKQTHYNCEGGDATNKVGTLSDKWTWSCGSNDCYQCKSGYEDKGGGNCVQSCDNSPAQDCENGEEGYTADGRWDGQSCSCQCPQGTSFNGGHGCECSAGEYWDGSKCATTQDDSHGGEECSNDRWFVPSWSIYCPGEPESEANSRQCESDAGAGRSCTYTNHCGGRAPMCECRRSDPCKSCEGCPSGTVAHNGTCISYSQSSACTCPSARISTCNNGNWEGGAPYSNKDCTSGVGCGGGGGGGCFLAGTPVITSEGPKNIEDIEVGDMVLSYNTVTLQNEYNKVSEKLVHEDNDDEVYELTIDGNLLEVTRVHLFFVVNDDNNEYQCNTQFKLRHAQSLRIGDKLMMSDGRYVTIENITHHHNYGTVYNLEVENVHNYFVAEGYLVHNGVSLEQKKLVVDDDIGGENCGTTVNAFRNENGALCGRYNSCDGSFSTAGC